MSYVYRERGRARDWDDPRSSVSVKRYVVADEEDTSERDVIFRRDNPVTGNRELVIRRTVEREQDPVVTRRVVRDDHDSRRHDRDLLVEKDYYEREYSQPLGLSRYSQSAESLARRDELLPQPSIICERPMIIQEARGPIYVNPRDSDYEIVRRSEVFDREPRDAEYVYGRRFREYEDLRPVRREISPDDSVSQANRPRRSDRDAGYSSDDSVVYVRKETHEYDGASPHRLRHLAEGVLVGVGAAEIIRDHRRKEGEQVSHGAGRVGRDFGYGVLGAVAAEAVSRWRSKSRRRSVSIDEERSSRRAGHRHRHRSFSGSRGRSHSRAEKLAEIGLGAAALAGVVALARSNNGDRRGRSRSRRRASSVASPDNQRSESHRRKVMTEAGITGAAVAGLVEAVHSRSRSRRGKRSPSVVKRAVPVILAGLGSAAAAGLYEDNKAKKQQRADSGQTGRSRFRNRGDPGVNRGEGSILNLYPDPAGMIEYGDHPVYGKIPAEDYYGRPSSPTGYYSDGAVPVARGGRGRSRSRSRDDEYRSSSSDSDPDGRRRHRSRDRKHHSSRSHDLVEGALAGAGLGYAAQKLAQRNKDRKSKEGYRYDEGEHEDPYEESYDPEPYATSPQPCGPGASPSDNQYPNNNFFPPPPGPASNYPPPPGPYHPADYPPPPGAAPPGQPYGGYPPPPPPAPQALEHEPYSPRPRRADENV